ncbi:TPA: hypothetical protein ACGC6G_003810, partial [Acinetobacter baumannii]
RGFDYHYALDSYKTDMQKHLDKTEAFKVQPKSVLNIDTSLELCKFIEEFNVIKVKEITENEPR